jgi:hypothetical protein
VEYTDIQMFGTAIFFMRLCFSPPLTFLHQLKSTMSRTVCGCGFRAICLTKMDTCIRWAARFCRRFRERIPGNAHHRAAKCTHITHSMGQTRKY